MPKLIEPDCPAGTCELFRCDCPAAPDDDDRADLALPPTLRRCPNCGASVKLPAAASPYVRRQQIRTTPTTHRPGCIRSRA